MGMHVGGRVSATDDDNDDVGKLTYTLMPSAVENEAGDVDYFEINKATGRITVAQPLDFDPIPGNDGPEYTMRVRVTDPNGDIDELPLTINVIQANDSPVATGAAELRVNENMDGGDYTGDPGLPVDMPTEPGAVDLALYTATDDDEIHEIDWDLEGVDARFFLLTDTEITNENSVRLQFRLEPESDFGPPNYEEPNDANGDNVYKVIVVATDGVGGRHERPVTVFVDNVYEPGELELSTEEPLVDEKIDPIVGKEITATVVDPDEGEAIVTWQWLHQRLPDDNTPDAPPYLPILGATSDTYTPVEADLGRYLRVVATYTDTTSCVDDPATAHDERVQLTGGPKKPVAEQTDGAMVEPCAAETDGRLYRVMTTTELAVRAEDSETPDTGPPQAPVFNENPASREVAENALDDDYVGAPIVASAAGGVAYSLPDRTDDDDNFDIDAGTGQISVNAEGAMAGALNYEEKPSYIVTVRATATASNLWSEAQVNIRLINLNEPPEFEADSAAETEIADYEENRTAVVFDYQAPDLDAPDPDRDDNIRWSVVGTDAADFTINGGKLRFRNPPDFENSTDRPGPGNNEYQITVRATEKFAIGGGPSRSADLDVMVTVTDVGEDGTVMFDLLEPEVGTPIMATATDPDDEEPTDESYQWYRSKTINIDRHNINLGDGDPPAGGVQWELADGEGDTGGTYTPNDADEGFYLLVRVTYGVNSYHGITAYRVRADVANEDNSAPGYGEESGVRMVDEDTPVGGNVGAPVVDTDEPNDDRLTYSLVAAAGEDEDNAGDLSFFAIDQATGQITLRKKLTHEGTTADGMSIDDRLYTGEEAVTPGEYKVVVRATDPSGDAGADETLGQVDDDENFGEVTVTITAVDVNEAPRIVTGNAELEVEENADLPSPNDETNITNRYQKLDEDANDIASEWRLEGADAAHFQLSTPADGNIARRIHFKSEPDYENPLDMYRDNIYEVTLMVCDRDGACGEKDVRIKVVNMPEDGALTLSPRQPEPGVAVVATLTDGDGIMTETAGVETIGTWQWYWTNTKEDYRVDEDENLDNSDVRARRSGANPDRRRNHKLVHADNGGRGPVPVCQGEVQGRNGARYRPTANRGNGVCGAG